MAEARESVCRGQLPQMSEQLRVMVIGAHPDDADILAGCTAAKLVDAGARIRFVSVTNGDIGHQSMAPAELAIRRRAEAQASSKTLGIEEYLVLDHHDCEVEATLELRRELTRIIRTFAPHIVMTHRNCDYHADHRAVGTAVMDATYLLGVPHWCPEVKRPAVLPAVFTLRDIFTVPREMRADLLVDCDPYITRCIDAVRCHESQIYEWLPFDGGFMDDVPDKADVAACRDYVARHWICRKAHDSERFADVWRQRHPEVELPKYLEAFEFSEYGRMPTPWELSWFE